jgi:hypothetical protein
MPPAATRAIVSYGTTYVLVTTGATYQAASTFCKSQGMELASIPSEALASDLHSKVQAHIGPSGEYFVGGSDNTTEGTWTWANGQRWSYTRWAAGQPSGGTAENCVVVVSGGSWHDGGCNFNYFRSLCGPAGGEHSTLRMVCRNVPVPFLFDSRHTLHLPVTTLPSSTTCAKPHLSTSPWPRLMAFLLRVMQPWQSGFFYL